MRRLRNIFAGVAALLGGCWPPTPAYAQEHALVQLVGITTPAMTKLQTGWFKGGAKIERAYCATSFWFNKMHGRDSTEIADVTWRIRDVTPADDSAATDDGVIFSCDMGQVPIHTHPPDCEETPSHKLVNCVPNCQPTILDYQAVEAFNAPFGIVQCGYNVFVPYSWRE